MISPFTYLPTDVCGDLALPTFPVIQDCVNYAQLQSEVCGLLVTPTGATPPTQWFAFEDWEACAKIDNTNAAKTHYLVGRGSFVQSQKTTVSLAGGRVEENRERTQRLVFNVSNMDNNHVLFGRKLQANKRNFVIHVMTIGGTLNRIIGGTKGMQPVFTDAIFNFNEGTESRESMQIIIDVEYFDFPAMQLPTLPFSPSC